MVLALPLKSLSVYLFKSCFVLSAIEEPTKMAFKRARKNRELFINEAPRLRYSVGLNNNQHKKNEADNKPEQDFEIGLPPQPGQYLKYPEYDWL
jgi:hypothetical protein